MPACVHNIRRPHFAPHITYDMPALCAAYQFPKVAPAKPAVIGIIELGGGYRIADVNAAFSVWGLPLPMVTAVSVDGGTNAPGGDADGEVLLDIEVAGAAYTYCTGQGANIRVYFAPNTDAGFAHAVTQAQADGCSVLSISWGAPEDQWVGSIPQFSAACAAAKAAGVTIFAASGDNDSGDGESGTHVDYPASDPNVIGCGGTSKTAAGEVVWSDGQNGTGGGFSTVFQRPAFQVGAPAGGGRMVPDVAANADPQTGYRIYLNGSWQVFGGTSAVAPLYAGLVAAIKSTGMVTGDILAKAWINKAAFKDVTLGNNGTYAAAVGPDPCTGLGVPIGTAILAALAGVVPPSPPVSPPVGGPVTVFGKVTIPPYTLPSQSFTIPPTGLFGRPTTVTLPGQTIPGQSLTFSASSDAPHDFGMPAAFHEYGWSLDCGQCAKPLKPQVGLPAIPPWLAFFAAELLAGKTLRQILADWLKLSAGA